MYIPEVCIHDSERLCRAKCDTDVRVLRYIVQQSNYCIANDWCMLAADSTRLGLSQAALLALHTPQH